MQTCAYKDHSDREAAKLAKRKQAFEVFIDEFEHYGGLATVDEVASLLNTTPTSVVGQVNSGRLIGIVDRPRQSYTIPMFQFDVSTKLKHLEEILAALGDISGVAACTWFLNPMEMTGATSKMPYAMLRAGLSQEELDEVLRDAKCFGTSAAS